MSKLDNIESILIDMKNNKPSNIKIKIGKYWFVPPISALKRFSIEFENDVNFTIGKLVK